MADGSGIDPAGVIVEGVRPVSERLRRGERIIRNFAVGAACLFVLIGAYGVWSTFRIVNLTNDVARIAETGMRARCEDIIASDWRVAASRAVAANQASVDPAVRANAAADLLYMATRTENSDAICARDELPKHFEPTPPYVTLPPFRR